MNIVTPSPEELEGNIDESKRSAELLELQETLSWPSVTLQDMDAYIPEVRHTMHACIH